MCKSSSIITFAFLVLLCLSESCSIRVIRQLSNPSSINSKDSTARDIKVHMRDGSLYVLDSLVTYANADTIYGFGSYYDKYRDLKGLSFHDKGNSSYIPLKISLDDVALVETNEVRGLTGRALTMALVGVPSVILSIYCISNPKACFGSCPTFYSFNGIDTSLMAEGFSSSILKAYEKDDVDMLYHARAEGNQFHLRMKNEALETHVIRYANLLVLPRTGNDRIFSDGRGDFFRSSIILSPVSCQASEGSCLKAVQEMDNTERYSLADSNNLAEREIIEVTFENIPGKEVGLVVGCRQSLLTTWIFYQSLSYLGNSAGYFAARIESGDRSLQRKFDRVKDVLGGIEVLMENGDGKWETVGQELEQGPLAGDVHLIKLPETNEKEIRLKLRLTKGLWRLNYLALASLDEKTEPIQIEPALVISPVNCNTADSLLKNQDNPLVTLPGDEYDICYKLPEGQNVYEIFLKTKGYYIEWMRDTWITEENLKRAALLFGFPRLFMKIIAKDFKEAEPSMEASFWNSRYVRQN